jgi:hypothetical protein
MVAMTLLPNSARAGESKFVLRDYIDQQWTNELLTYSFSAERGTCDARSVTLTGPHGAVPVQLTDITYWPDTRWVKTAKLAFITSLAPLATDTYTVRCGDQPATGEPLATDLTVTQSKDQVEITTGAFGARLLLGEHTYPQPAPAAARRDRGNP